MTTWVQNFYSASADTLNIYICRPAAAIPLFLLLAGFFGLVYHRKNIIRFLVSPELLILAVNLLFITAAVYVGDLRPLFPVLLIIVFRAAQLSQTRNLLGFTFAVPHSPFILGGITIQATESDLQLMVVALVLLLSFFVVLIVRRLADWVHLHRTNLLDSIWQNVLNVLYLSLSPDLCLLFCCAHILIVAVYHTPLYIIGCAILFFQFYFGTWLILRGSNRKAVMWYLTVAPAFIYLFWVSRYNIGINYWYVAEVTTSLFDSIGALINWILNGPGGGVASCCPGIICDGSCGDTRQLKPVKIPVENTIKNRVGPEWVDYLKSKPDLIVRIGAVMGGIRGFLRGKPRIVPGALAAAGELPPVKPPVSIKIPLRDGGVVYKGPLGIIEIEGGKSFPAPSPEKIREFNRRAEALERADRERAERAEAEGQRQEALLALKRFEITVSSMRPRSPTDVFAHAAQTLKDKPSVLGFIAAGVLAGAVVGEISVKPPVKS
jgi:NADH:ubiquinone oxidoreductase subunit K